MPVIGEIDKISSKKFLDFVKEKLNTYSVRVTNISNDKLISKVAVLGGSGGDFVEEVALCGCDAFVTGEISYHDAQKAFELGLSVYAVGHFESENPVVEKLSSYLSDKTGLNVIKATDDKSSIKIIK